MKIAYLFGSLTHGGAETMMLDVFRNASRNGLDAFGIYRKTGEYENAFKQSGLSVYKLSAKKNLIKYLYLLRKLIVNNEAAVVHAQQPIDALYAYIACRGTGIRIMLTFHGYEFNHSLTSLSIIRLIIKRTHCNIFVSESQRNYYTKKYHLHPDNQKVVYNGISFQKIAVSEINPENRTAASQNIRHELQISQDTFLLGSVGNFLPGRDQMTLCRFAKELKQKGIDFRLLLIGKRLDFAARLFDQCVDYCKDNCLTDNVIFSGLRTDVPLILSQLDAFVYATDHDTFGIAVVEAMASAIPVFVNDWEVMNEITDRGKYATLYKTKDENDLLEKILLFLKEKNEFFVKAVAANHYVRDVFSIEKHIADLRKIYELYALK